METRGRDAAIFRGADVARQISIERGEIPELVLNGCSRMPLDNDASPPGWIKTRLKTHLYQHHVRHRRATTLQILDGRRRLKDSPILAAARARR